MSRIEITIEFDDNALSGYTDQHLAALWHVVQANPADAFNTSRPGEVAERVGREIIRRWLRGVEPELWTHQGRHYYWRELSKLAKYQPGGDAGTAEFDNGTWVPRGGDPL